MAEITNDSLVKGVLHQYFSKNGVQNCFGKNSPVVQILPFVHIDGDSYVTSIAATRGGAVSSSAVVSANASKTGKALKFTIKPGKIFSSYSFNAAEVAASASNEGAFARSTVVKFAKAVAAFRQTFAAALYGSGWGEVGLVLDVSTDTSGETAIATITVGNATKCKIDVESELVFKKYIKTNTSHASGKVIARNGTTFKVELNDKTSTVAVGDVIALKGGSDANGGRMPAGFFSYLPFVGGRKGTEWEKLLKTPEFGADISIAPDKLAGYCYVPTAKEDMTTTIQNMVTELDAQGANVDMIIMNNLDYSKFITEVNASNRYLTSNSGKKNTTVGWNNLSAAVGAQYIENIYREPALEEGVVIMGDSSAAMIGSYTNMEKVIRDNKAGNDAVGKVDIEDFTNEAGDDEQTMALLKNGFLFVGQGEMDDDGATILAQIQYFGSLIIEDPSRFGVGLFYNANGYDNILGYKNVIEA
jgi:hypothetical protein